MKAQESTIRLRYTLARYLRKIAARIPPKSSAPGITFPSIGAVHLPKNAPRALIFFAAAGIQRLVEGRLDDPIFKKHTIHGDAVAMTQELNRQGYIVDYCDLWKVAGQNVDWDRYAVVIDNWDNLRYAPAALSPTKIAFMNGWYWLEQNTSELERIRWFKERTGIVIPPNRQIIPNLSDEYADYVTYYGTPMQADSFSKKPKRHRIDLCALCGPAPHYRKKDIPQAKNRFMWMGGGGMLHKGMDIIIEAFAQMPETELFVAGNLQEEPLFWRWAQPILARHTNIHLLGWVDTTSAEFDAIADTCIGTVYASCSEGGPASVARCLFNGQIPIITKTSFVRAETLGYFIEGTTAQELIASTIDRVRHVMSLPESELSERSAAVREFAMQYHTREAFTRSFASLIETITHTNN
jgi:glycosyltransferase involved in cell wall biosynthesis